MSHPSPYTACGDAPTTKDAESGLTWKAMCEACYTNESNDLPVCINNVMEKYASAAAAVDTAEEVAAARAAAAALAAAAQSN